MARGSTSDKGSATSTTNNHPLGLNVPALEKSFNLLVPQAEQLVERFYEELFKRHPDVRLLFKHTSVEKQQHKLLETLKLVMANLNSIDKLITTLTELGQRHQRYGAIEAHYAAVATTLMDVMKEFAGRAWTKEAQEAWSYALGTIAEVMLGVY